jgi:CheY-like chemotaxis protein
VIQSSPVQTILVVDDVPVLCELIEVILCSAGYCVLTAQNGADALRIARNTPRIDLLLSDLEMPRLRGDELATKIATLHPAVPIIFVSSSNRRIETTQPFEFLAKPFTVAELRGTVRRALRTPLACSENSNDADP